MTTAKRVKDAKIEKKFELARDKKEKTPKFSSRRHNRCKIMRTAARLPAQVWRVPLVFPRAGAARRDSGSFEVVVVVGRV